MNKKEIIEDIRMCTGKSFLKRVDIDQYLHQRKGTATKLMKDYPYLGSSKQPKWFINDVADAIFYSQDY